MTSERWRKLALVGVAGILLGNSIGVAVGAGLHWDFANFYVAGHKIRVGEAPNLYDRDALVAGEEPLASMLFVATPLSAALYAPLSAFAPTTALRLFKLADAIALLTALWLLYARARDSLPPVERMRFAGLFAVAALVFQPLWTIYMVGGQTTPFILLAFVLAASFHVDRRFAASAICLVVAVVIKPVVAPALALVALTSGWRFFFFSAASGLVALSLSVLAFGWPVHAAFIDLLGQFSGNSVSWIYNSGLTTPLESLRVGSEHTPTTNPRAEGLSILVQIGRGTAGLALTWAVWRAFQSPFDADTRRRWLLHVGVVFTLAIAPVVWEHYLMLLVPTLVLLATRWDEIPKIARVAVVVAIAAAPFQNLLVTLQLWERTEDVGALGHFLLGGAKALPLAGTLLALAVSSPVLLRDPAVSRRAA